MAPLSFHLTINAKNSAKLHDMMAKNLKAQRGYHERLAVLLKEQSEIHSRYESPLDAAVLLQEELQLEEDGKLRAKIKAVANHIETLQKEELEILKAIKDDLQRRNDENDYMVPAATEEEDDDDNDEEKSKRDEGEE